MNKLSSILLSMLTLLLCACGVQVQLQTLEPAQVNLRRGSMLRVYSLHHNRASRNLSIALNERLRESGFYTLGGTDATLYIEHAHEHTEVYTNHTCSSDEECHCPSTIETTYGATVRVSYKGQILYLRTLSDYSTYEALAREIVNDLVPHPVTYSVRIKPQRGNDMLEHAAEACRHGDWLSGRSLAESSLQAHPNDPEAYYLLGIIARHDGKYQVSDSYFSRAADIEPSARYTGAIQENAVLRQKEQLARAQLNS